MARRIVLATVPALALAACSTAPAGPQSVAVYDPPPGINQVLEDRIAAAPGHSLIVGDLNMGPGAPIPRHFHHGEEYIYLIGGSATVSRAGQPDLQLGPGQSVTIAPGVVHWGTAGPEGMRGISVWIKDDDHPLREMVAE
ncbi:cupin domain-containing protein [Alteraurantiacibacter buctensis]|uniref:Cupin domain-containing protein n=1 Tax=Alteraurantiacibacter buctensis TaxID=1503981 RepID=A0A844YSX2_9SPHN|nr:cupin domain-containing protein [Alteraurantiacibacter buctensis]MXO70639.1 cupin domain-containing protein [Alteraurantiacibacter buctensis]